MLFLRGLRLSSDRRSRAAKILRVSDGLRAVGRLGVIEAEFRSIQFHGIEHGDDFFAIIIKIFKGGLIDVMTGQ